ncbi:hypothetical protein [Nocardia jiangxiensis]|uniref:Uncharacterized protein n=1 Tax=Nocardia jiangxiensis TaxID=282685 RepID=A0ABW6S232_9NOCA|nr:hypothetical protein [Nocardia jiangxiensis]
MTVVNPPQTVARGVRKVDIAGSQWPLYKLEALALGVVAGLVLVLVTGSPQVAVLTAAMVAAARWIAAVVVRSNRPAR